MSRAQLRHFAAAAALAGAWTSAGYTVARAMWGVWRFVGLAAAWIEPLGLSAVGWRMAAAAVWVGAAASRSRAGRDRSQWLTTNAAFGGGLLYAVTAAIS